MQKIDSLHPIIREDIDIVLTQTRSDVIKLSGKNVLITGASGMLARYLVYTIMQANKTILDKPVQLYLITRSTKKAFGENPNITYLPLDISQKSPDVRGVHYIIHAASKSAPKHFTRNMVDTIDTNIRGTYHLLESADKYLESFLFFSSGAIYGTQALNSTFDETHHGSIDHLSKRSCYTIGKLAAETILINYFYEHKLPVKVARIFHTFGPGINLSDGRVFSDFMRFALAGEDIRIIGDPTIARPFLYIRDAAIMFFKLLLSDKNGEVYNIANDGQVLSVQQFAQAVTRVFAQQFNRHIDVLIDSDKTKDYYKDLSQKYHPSIAKFESDFNFRPQVDIEETIERTARSLLEK